MTLKEIEDKLFSHFLYMPTLPIKVLYDSVFKCDDGEQCFADVTDCYIADYVESEYSDYGILIDTNLSVSARNGEGFTGDDLEYLEQIYPTMDIEDMTDTTKSMRLLTVKQDLLPPKDLNVLYLI